MQKWSGTFWCIFCWIQYAIEITADFSMILSFQVMLLCFTDTTAPLPILEIPAEICWCRIGRPTRASAGSDKEMQKSTFRPCDYSSRCCHSTATCQTWATFHQAMLSLQDRSSPFALVVHWSPTSNVQRLACRILIHAGSLVSKAGHSFSAGLRSRDVHLMLDWTLDF